MNVKKLNKARAKAKAAESSVPKGKAANYPLTPWMKSDSYDAKKYGGVDVEAQKKAEDATRLEMAMKQNPYVALPDFDKPVTILRGQAVDAFGQSVNDKYLRQEKNPNVNFKSGGKMKVKKYATGGNLKKTVQKKSYDGNKSVKDDTVYVPGISKRSAKKPSSSLTSQFVAGMDRRYGEEISSVTKPISNAAKQFAAGIKRRYGN